MGLFEDARKDVEKKTKIFVIIFVIMRFSVNCLFENLFK